MPQSDALHPPRARLAFRVGVVGHRPNRLPKDEASLAILRGRIEAALEAVAGGIEDFRAADADGGFYAPDAPLLRAVSPLAEGSDRMFAEAALKLGWALDCPMPFPQAEFERDFQPGLEPDSLARFHHLLAQARDAGRLAVFELDGDRAEEAAAYGAAGRVVLNQSDLLVVIWDGDRPAGGGGTVDTLHDAIRFHVPVLWIDPNAPYGWMVLRRQSDLDCLKEGGVCRPVCQLSADPADDLPRIRAAVAEIVRQEVDLPNDRSVEHVRAHGHGRSDDGGEEARERVDTFFGETRPDLNVAFIGKLLRDLVGSSKWRMPALRTEDFVGKIRAAWPASAKDERPGAPTSLPGEAQPVRYAVNARLREHFAWSDGLADLCADNHRSGYVLSYLLAALAVLVALLPMAMGWHGLGDTLCILAEFIIMAWILLLFGRARHFRYHERWMDYRLLAELIRQLRFLAPLGGGRPLARAPIHLSGHGDPARSWMSWHLRAIARSVGLPNVRVTTGYLAECLADLAEIADGPNEGQHGFHRLNHERSERIHHRLHTWALWLFGLTIAGILVHLALHLGGGGAEAAHHGAAAGHHAEPTALQRAAQVWNPWLVVSSAFMPALGAAFAGINNTGEFTRLSKRSRAMADAFAEIARRIEVLHRRQQAGGSVELTDVLPVATSMAQTMVEEVVDWRVVVLDRPQSV